MSPSDYQDRGDGDATGNTRTARTRLSPEARRTQLVETAAALFRQYGSRFTSAQLASAAGVSEGTVFRYFPDMKSLMRNARRQAIGLNELIPELRDAAGCDKLRDRLICAGNALTGRIVETARLVETAGVVPGQQPHQEIQEVFDALTPLFRDSSVPGMSEHQQVAMFLGLLVSGTVFAMLDPASESEAPNDVEQIVDLFLNGLTSLQTR